MQGGRGYPSRGTGAAHIFKTSLGWLTPMRGFLCKWVCGSLSEAQTQHWFHFTERIKTERKKRAEEEANKRVRNSCSWKPKWFHVFGASFADEDQAAKSDYASNLVLTNCELWLVWHTESGEGAQLLTPLSNFISWTGSCKSILLLLLNTLS